MPETVPQVVRLRIPVVRELDHGLLGLVCIAHESERELALGVMLPKHVVELGDPRELRPVERRAPGIGRALEVPLRDDRLRERAPGALRLAGPPFGELLLVELRYVFAVDNHAAGVGLVDAGDQVEQGRLA